LEPEFANNLRTFLSIANDIIHGAKVSDEIKTRLSSVGVSLIAKLHYQRKVLDMVRDFYGHGLWHMHKYLTSDSRNYYFWSAVAASLPEFEYNYDIYKEAGERHNQKVTEEGHEGHSVSIVPLDEFVNVLEFREKELLRLINVWNNPDGDTWRAFEKANYWEWPLEWGDLGWNCPIIRERLSLYEAEGDLMQTRNALNRYRLRLVGQAM